MSEQVVELLSDAAIVATASPESDFFAVLRDCAEDVITRIGKAYAEQFEKALERARHELTTLHGLHACDGFDAYSRAQRDGIDPAGAWDSFLESTWQIDVSQTIEAIDIALSPSGIPVERKEEEEWN